jgi:hypothetical protein
VWLCSARIDDDIESVIRGGAMWDDGDRCENPKARFTTVLVVGITGRVGRILVHPLPLSLPSYSVRRLFYSA